MGKRLYVPYLTRAKEEDTIDYNAVRWVAKTVSYKQTKYYHGMVALMNDLSARDLLLMHHLGEIMDDLSLVRNTTQLKRNFNRLMDKKYSNSTINRSFKNLTEKRIIIKISRKRGLYKMNPQYIFRGSDIDRKKSITRDLENKDKPLINQYRAETFDYDMARKLKKKKDDSKL